MVTRKRAVKICGWEGEPGECQSVAEFMTTRSHLRLSAEDRDQPGTSTLEMGLPLFYSRPLSKLSEGHYNLSFQETTFHHFPNDLSRFQPGHQRKFIIQYVTFRPY